MLVLLDKNFQKRFLDGFVMKNNALFRACDKLKVFVTFSSVRLIPRLHRMNVSTHPILSRIPTHRDYGQRCNLLRRFRFSRQYSHLSDLLRVSSVLQETQCLQFSSLRQAPHLSNKESENEDGSERGVATKARPRTKKPSMYRVLLMNDDYTPMEFVVKILMTIFNKTQEEATQVMLNVHQNGVGVCGVYTFEIAETKVAQVMDAAKRSQHPLQCTLEKA